MLAEGGGKFRSRQTQFQGLNFLSLSVIGLVKQEYGLFALLLRRPA